MTVYVAEEFTPQRRPTSSGGTSPTSTGPCSPWSTCPRWSRARCSPATRRSPKSLRRLFLDEFVGDLDITGDQHVDATVGLRRAEELLRPRVLRVRRRLRRPARRRAPRLRAGVEPPHEGARVGPADGYLEQSTRYIAYDARLGGRYRYYRDPAVLELAARHSLRRRHGPALRHLRRARAQQVPEHFRVHVPEGTRATPTSCTARRSGPRRFDALRGILPAASLSNVGIYGTGQGYEQLLLRMRAHPLPEARAYADLMLHELRKVIPSFLKRVDLDDRGVAWTAYLEDDPARHGGRRRAALRRRQPPRQRGGRARSSTSTPTPRSSWSRRCSIPPRPARAAAGRPGPGHRHGGAPRRRAGLRGGAGATAATSRDGPSSGSTTASTCSPTTARSATSSATGC